MQFSLGTAQLGMDYGLSNKAGRPDTRASLDILKTAVRCGASWLDTAPAYGESESVIGRFREEFPGEAESLNLCSKLSKKSGVSKDSEVAHSIDQSLARLNTESIDLLLLHDETTLDQSGTIDSLKNEVESGRIRGIGVSTYSPSYALRALVMDEINAIQVPLNALDHRLLKAGFFEKAEQSGKLIFIRSIFLQGLLLMDIRDIPKNIPGAIEAVEQLTIFCSEREIPRDLFCVAWISAYAGASIPIFGAENCMQIEENAKLLGQTNSVPSEFIEEWTRTFMLPDERLVHPPEWPKTFF